MASLNNLGGATNMTSSAGSGAGGVSGMLKTITDFVQSGNNKYIIFAIVILVALSLGIYYAYKSNLSPELNKFFNQIQGQSVKSEVDSNAAESKDATLYLFKVDWCPHCKKAEPIFQEVEQQVKVNPIEGHNVTFKIVDCEAEPTMADKFSVSGYPTIKLDKGGEIIEYDAKPDKQHLMEFLKSSL